MPIYRGTTPLKAYKGDMQPVNVYRGSTKVAGWHSVSYSGTSPLTVDYDYNVPPDALVIDGRCVQTGTPSPSSPAPISTITGDMTITGADGAASDTVTVAIGSAVCASLPNGTHDSYDAVTGVLTKRVGKVVFDGSADELWAYERTATRVGVLCHVFRISNSLVQVQTAQTSISDRFIIQTDLVPATIKPFSTDFLYLAIETSRLTSNTTGALRTWLAANPTTVYYKLYTPTTVQLTPHLPVVRTGIKTLSIGADVVPTLSATVKSIESAITSITQG